MADEPAPAPASEPNAVVADTAALAANSAAAAQEAAAVTMEHAHAAVAGVAQQAANEIASTEERLSEWQNLQAKRLETLELKAQQQQTQIETRLKETTEQLSSILSRLDKPPASPESQANGQGEAAPPAAASPPEPKPPEKRKAHRWI